MLLQNNIKIMNTNNILDQITTRYGLNLSTVNDITLIQVDKSGSMFSSTSAVQRGLKSQLDAMPQEKTVIIVFFDSDLHLMFAGTVADAKTQNIWNAYTAGSTTSLHDAFVFASEFFQQLPNTILIKVWVCITDGHDTSSHCGDAWINALTQIHIQEVLIQLFAVGQTLTQRYAQYFANGAEIATWTYETTEDVFQVATDTEVRYRNARSAGLDISVSRSMSQPTQSERSLLSGNYVTTSTPPPSPVMPNILYLSETEQHAFLDKAKIADFEEVKRLINSNINYINVQPAGRWSALHQAAYFGSVETVDWLLARGANKSAVTNDGDRPFDLAYTYIGDVQHIQQLA